MVINKVIFHAKSILLPLQFHSQQAAQFIQQIRSLGPERGRERWEDKEVKGKYGCKCDTPALDLSSFTCW